MESGEQLFSPHRTALLCVSVSRKTEAHFVCINNAGGAGETLSKTRFPPHGIINCVSTAGTVAASADTCLDQSGLHGDIFTPTYSLFLCASQGLVTS